jgi:acyl carrier protein
MDSIIEILSKIRPEIDYRSSCDYVVDGLLDSFDIIVLVADLDEFFNISIPGSEIIPENFRNAETILHLAQKYESQT